jgi:TonB family protein
METASFGNGWEGRVVEGRFPLLERLEGSANCVSFLTVLQGLQEAVIRLISANDAEADTYIAQWEFAKTLSHPHLAKILAEGRCVIGQSDLVYVVTERSNATLSQTIQTRTLKADSARETFEPILNALSYLHKTGIVHGHVNPSSIQFAEMKPKLSVTDLLIAGTAKRSISQRSKYDAPELTQGMVTAACDTWSVGMIMCEAMTQALPSWDSSRDGEPEVTKSLPGPFREIVQDCLRVDPQRRPTIENIQWRMQEPVQEPARERKQERLEESKILPLFDEPVPVEVVSRPKAASQVRTEEPRVPEGPEGLPPPPPPLPVQKIETEAPSEPVIFSKSLTHFGEPGGGPLRIVGYGFVLLAVLALASFLLVRAGKIKIPAGMGSQKTPAASTPDAEKQSAVPTPVPTESTPDRAETQAGSPVSQAQPESTPPTEALKAPEANLPVPQTEPKEASRAEVKNAPTLEPPATATHSSAIRVEHRENSEGLVAKRVMPNVAPGALAGMRRPVEVVIRVSVNREGAVSDASYVSPGPGNYFARQAQRAAQSWTFTPPTRNGNAERSVWVLRFNFEREKTEATASLESK